MPICAILTEEEARLVLSAPTETIFTDGYMSRASVYQTDQDRDLPIEGGQSEAG